LVIDIVRILLVLLVTLLAACTTTPPIDISNADPTLTPDRALADIELARGRHVAWGGTVVSLRNLKDATEIEVLGYPLENDARPDTGAAPQHRFLLVREGYLEAADYRSGRLVSAAGTIAETREGRVGEATYIYPVLRADQVYLWPVYEERRGPNVQFGIGVIFGR
jgi:outer membrane lipoprotein